MFKTKIDSIIIENFRSIKKIKIENLKQLNIFIGKNNVGKSNILLLLSSIFDKSLYTESDDKHLVNEKKNKYYFDQEKPVIFSLTYYIPKSELLKYDRSFALDENQCVMIISALRGTNFIYKIERKPRYDPAIGFLPKKFLRPDLIQRSIIHLPANRSISPDEKFNHPFKISKHLLPNSIRNALNRLKRGDKDQNQKLVDFLIILEQFNLFKGTPDVFAEGEKVDICDYYQDQKFILNTKGSGTQLLIFLLFKIFYFNKDFFTIEEPEIHCHSGLQRKILEFLEEQSEGRQFFVSTHSPIFIKPSDKTSMYLVYQQPDEEDEDKLETKIKYIEGPEEFYRISEELGVKFSDILLNKKIIFVEGKSDQDFYQVILKKLKEISSQAIFIPAGGDNIKNYALLIHVLLNLNVTHELYYIVDSDKKSSEEKKQEILDFVKNKNPDISDEQMTFLQNSIYGLEEKAIESYINFYHPELIENLFKIKKDEIEKYYSNIPEEKRGSYLELKKFLKLYQIKFVKTKHVKPFIEGMKLKELDPEIPELIMNLMSD